MSLIGDQRAFETRNCASNTTSIINKSGTERDDGGGHCKWLLVMTEVGKSKVPNFFLVVW